MIVPPYKLWGDSSVLGEMSFVNILPHSSSNPHPVFQSVSFKHQPRFLNSTGAPDGCQQRFLRGPSGILYDINNTWSNTNF